MNMQIKKIVLEVLLLPFLPIRLGWKWSAGFTVKFGSGGGSSFLGRIVGTVLIAGVLYSLIGSGINAIVGKKDAPANVGAAPLQVEQATETAQ